VSENSLVGKKQRAEVLWAVHFLTIAESDATYDGQDLVIDNATVEREEWNCASILSILANALGRSADFNPGRCFHGDLWVRCCISRTVTAASVRAVERLA
jgi:hypothetical protein